MTKNKRRARKTQHPGPGTQSRTWHHDYNGVPTVRASRTDEGGNPRTALVRRRPSPTTRPHPPPGGLRARASRFTAHVCTLVSEEHGTAPRIRMAASPSGGAEPLEARRWRPLRELGKVCINERCAARSKGAFGPVAIRGPFPQAGQRTTRRGFGKHPAPSGALRRDR